MVKSIFFLTCLCTLLSSCSSAEPVPNQNSKVPIVYSKKYKISLGGLEKLHPFDIAKYDKIYAQLKKDGLVTKNNWHEPEQLTHEQLRLVHSEDYIKSWKKYQYLDVAGWKRSHVSSIRGQIK